MTQTLPDPRTVPTAGSLLRLGAYLVDAILLAPLIYLTYYFMVERPLLWGIIGVWAIELLYKPLTEAFFGATFGKYIFRMRVVDRGLNRRIGLNQSFVRYLPWAIGAFASLFVLLRLFDSSAIEEASTLSEYQTALLGFPLNQNILIVLLRNLAVFSASWIVTDPWNRALHDRIAQTFVVRKLPTPPSRPAE